jgi:hypothetical protein
MSKLTAIVVVILLTSLMSLTPANAQDVTPEVTPEPTDEITPEVTVEPTDETTPEVTTEPTDETTPEVTAEPTDETTPEVTTEPTDETTPEVTPDVTATATIPPTLVNREGALDIANQLSVNGTVIVDTIVSPRAGWVGIHLNLGGQPGPVVGIAPVQAGVSQNVPVTIDILGATPSLFAVLHADTDTIGEFEFGQSLTADAQMISGGIPVGMPFQLTSISAFDQLPSNDEIVVASVIWNAGGWLVIHADENGQPGPVIGQTRVNPGTSVNVRVPVDAAVVTPVVWPMLHVDDNALGVYEFGTVAGADLPVQIENQVATRSLNVTTQPVVVTTAGATLPVTAPDLPAIDIDDQAVPGVGTTNATTLFVNSSFSAGSGWIDIHADAGNHPGVSLGVTALPSGASGPSTIAIDPEEMNPATPPFITPIVWPMLHIDDHEPGVYEFLIVPGADLPIVVNGAVVTYPVNITGAATTTPPTATATGTITVTTTETVTATATMTGTETTPEVTVTVEPTDETTPEVTVEPTDETTPEVTTEPTDETTPEVTVEPTVEVTPELTAETGV